MVHLWKRVGTGSWVVIALIVASLVAVVGLTGAKAYQPPGEQLLMPFSEFQPLHARKSVLVIDVRDADSFMTGRIPGAMHVGSQEIPARFEAIRRASKGRVVVTYCSCPTEASSLRAAKALTEAGITARALVGGFPRWVESGGVVERG